MKKLFTHIIIVLTLVFSLSGCYPNKPMYNQEDANSVTSKGTEMMQAWLDNNDPNAKWAEMICDVFPDCFTKNGAAFNLIADEE